MARMDVAMGGRVAEELVFGHDNITSGTSIIHLHAHVCNCVHVPLRMWKSEAVEAF